MIKQLKRFLAVTLSFVLICLMANTTNSYAQTTDIGKSDYSQVEDEYGNLLPEYEYVPDSVEYGTITVPEEVPDDVEGGPKRYILSVVGQEINVDTLVLEAGSNCTIMDSETSAGILNVTSSIVVSDGATLTLDSNANIPVVGGSKITVYDSYWNDETGSTEYIDITGDDTWMWKSFVYETGKWVAEPEPYNPYRHEIVIEGFKNINDIKLTFSYSLDNTNWTTLVYENVQQENEVFDYYNSDDASINFAFDYAPVVEQMGGSYTGDVHIKLEVVEGSEIISYAFLEPEHVDVVSSTTLSEDKKTFTYSQNESDENYSNVIFLGLAYPNEGDPKAKDLIENELFAYGDLNGDGTVNMDDIYDGFTSELCCRYFWEEGSILNGNFEITRPGDFGGRLEFGGAEAYTALDKDGNEVPLNKYPYVINLGVDHEGNPVQAEGYVYALGSNTDILVYDGRDFYIRDLKTDAVSFNDKTDDDKAICVCSDFESVENLKINGNGGGSYQNINPENSNMFTVFLSNEKFVEKYNSYYGGSLENYFDDEDVCTKLRIMKPGKTYIAISKEAGEGEQKKVPGIDFDSVDSICETGVDKYTEVFLGDDIIHINPVSGATGLANTEIASVSLAESSQTDGIKLTKIADDDYKLEFKSNYYDEATIIVTYTNGTTSKLTIKRQALVISYLYLEDRGPGVSAFVFDSGATVNYDYFAGEQVIIYATYYHPSNYETASGDNSVALYVTNEDGSVDIITPLKHTAATADNVATTEYLIDLVPAKEKLPDGFWGEPLDNISLSPINALVVNDGFDNDTTFGGTQVGNGKGVYWDGEIVWNYE